MMRNLTGKANMNDEKSPPHYLRGPASSCHDFCKYGKKNDSMSAQRHVKVPAHLGRPNISNAESSTKKLSTAQGRQKGERHRLSTAFQLDDNVSCGSGVNKMSILQYSDVFNDPTECPSDESVSMKPRPPSPFQEGITTFENNSSVLDDESLEEPTIVMPEEEPSIDGSSDGSAIMELETPPSRESMVSDHASSGPKLKKSLMVSEVQQQTAISSVSGPTNQAKESSNRYRSMKQGPAATMQKSMTSAMAISSKDPASIKPKEHKHVKSLMEEDKGMRDAPMRRSSMLMKPNVPYRVEAKKKVDEFVELDVTNEKSQILDKIVKSVKPKQAGLMHVKEPCTSLSPIIIKKKTSSSTKRIQLSPMPALMLKTKAPVVKCRLPLMDLGKITGQRSQESSKIARTAGMSKLREEKLLKQSVASPVHKSTVNRSPAGINARKSRSVKNQVVHGKMDAVDEKVKEKTIHVVDEKLVGTALKPVEQKHIKLSSQKSSRFPLSSSASISSSYKEENDGSLLTQSEGSGSASCGESKGRRAPFCFKKSDGKTIQKRTANASLEEKALSTYKITFCRGKVVSPLRESTGQRRLRFLPAKAAAESEKLNGEIGMRSFRKNGESPAASPATPSPGSPTVLLRHQDVQEKNTQALFNDVIEETAKRLVESRKSKVKALVGAFETIISLQERTVQ